MTATLQPVADHRLRKHADYQRVYRDSRRQSAKQMAWFAAPRSATPEPQTLAIPSGPRIGLTVPKAIGNAVVRNRIKRRMRAVVRKHIHQLTAPVDLVLHPRRAAAEIDIHLLENDVVAIFTRVQKEFARQA
jgi:ribonuclease P protein component